MNQTPPPLQQPVVHRRLALRRIILPGVLLSGLVSVGGCRLSGTEILEARLRQHESTIRELEQQLDSAGQQLTDQEKELLTLKQLESDSPFHTAGARRPLESKVAWGAVRDLRVQKLTAGVLPSADGGLQISLIVQPLDAEGETVKVAGPLTVHVQRPGTTGYVAQADFSSLDSRKLWSNGLIGRGFHVRLPLSEEESQKLQTGDTLLLTATLDLENSRRFETSTLIKVRLAD